MPGTRESKKQGKGSSPQISPLWAVVENSFDSVLLADQKGKILQVNHPLRDFLGWKETDLKTIANWAKHGFASDDHQKKLLAEWNACVRKHDIHEGEYHLRNNAGRDSWCKIRLVPLPDDHVAIIIRDFTEVWKAAEGIGHAKHAIQESRDAFYLIGKDGQYRYANVQACKSLGYTEKELRGMTVSDIDPALPKSAWPKHWKQIQKEKMIVFEATHRRKDGSCFPVEVSVSHQTFHGQEFHYAFVRDISAQKEREQHLRQTHFAVEHASDAFFLFAKTGALISVNKSACKSLQYKQEELVGMSLWEFDPDFEKKEWKKGWAAIKKFGSRTMESVHQRKDGTTFPVEVTVSFFAFEGEEFCLAFARDITERKFAAEALRESEEHVQETEQSLHTMLQSTPLGIHMYHLEHDERLVFTGANTAADSILGIRNAQFIGKAIEDAFPSLVATDVPSAYRRVAKTGKPWHREQISYQDNQITGAYEVNAFQIAPDRMVAMFADITERKRAEMALRNSEDRYRRVSEMTSDFSYGFRVLPDNTLETEWVTGALSRISGYTPQDLIKIGGWEKLVHPDDDVVSQAQFRALLSGKAKATEYRIVTKTGEVRYVRNIAKPIWDRKEKRTTFIYGAVEDITERKDAIEEMTRLSTAVNQAAESIVITDEAGTILYANPYFERMTGYKIKDVIGKNPRLLKSGKHNAAFYKAMWKQISSGKTWRGHFINQKKDGTVFEENAVISPVTDSSGNIVNYVAVKRDVSQERLLEGQVRQSQKMAAIGQLAHKITHTFTNILMMILGNAQLAKDKVRDRPDLVQNMDEVINAANRVSTLTAELLSFAHPAPLSLKCMRLDKALIGVEDLLKPTISHDVNLNIRLSKTGKVNIDPGQIEQVVVHLAINAVEAMPRGGPLIIEAKHADLTPEEAVRLQMNLQESDRHDGDFAMLLVSDEGCGMTEEQRLKMFEPFFTTKPDQQNAGLGLSTVYSIVDQHNGHIVVDTVSEKGTTFKIYLPVVG